MIISLFTFTGSGEESAAKYYHHWYLKDGFVRSYFLKRYHAFTCGFLLNEYNTTDQYDTLMGYRARFTDLSKMPAGERSIKYQKKLDSWNNYWIDTASTQKIYTRIEGLISMLQTKGIQTVLVTMPVSQAFYALFNPELIKRNKQANRQPHK